MRAAVLGRSIRLDGWTVGPYLAAAIVALPVATVVAVGLFGEGEDVWRHLAATVLPVYAWNSLQLLFGVGLGVLTIGVGTAWLVTMCRFPGRSVLEWALLLPLAMPAYVIAYVYTDLLEYAGPVQDLLRDAFGWTSARDYWFPEIRSMGGAIAMFSLVLYPYVYLLSRAAFLEQSVGQLKVSRTLGRGAWATFAFVAVPLARPSIAIGVSLALMEVLNDLGTVEFFAVNTFTRGIFNVWFGMNNVAGAAQIATLLLLVVLAILAAESYSRRRRRFRASYASYHDLPASPLARGRAAAAVAACALPVALGFVLPALVLADYALRHYADALAASYWRFVGNSIGLSSAAAAVAVILAISLAYARRLRRDPLLDAAIRLAVVGYAVPGAVLAIGVLIPFGWFDNTLDALMRGRFDISTGLLLSGTLFAALFAYVVRFLAVAYGALDASFAKVSVSMDRAARTLGAGPRRTLLDVHVPLVGASTLSAALLVFVDGMKELPMTLILRPFNFDTLATHVFEFAGDERLEPAALAALTIVVAGIIPVVILNRMIGASRPGSRQARD